MVRAVLRPLLLSIAVALAIHVAASGCDDVEVPHACSEIPEGGCPRAHGVACQDPACDAVYLCRANNVWELDQRCPPHDAGVLPEPVDVVDAGDADADADAAGPTVDAGFDAPPGAFGGPGCASLQTPDCALGVALACGNGCCGCEDLFVCEDQGWTLWGACPDGGVRKP